MTALIRVAIVGYGLAVDSVVTSMVGHGGFDIVACVDPDPTARARFSERVGGRSFESMTVMLDAVSPEAVYIATPTRTHEALTREAVMHGAHVLVEKPMALDLDQAQRMIRDAEEFGRVLMVNHKRSVDREILAMRTAIRTDEVGPPRWLNRLHFSDWMYRWRASQERDPTFGGVVLRQGAHEFDVLRALLPSPPARIRGWVGDLAPDLPGEGAYSAWIECEDGTMASSIYNGYDRFRTDELTVGILPSEVIGASQRTYAANMTAGVDEYELKRTIGHPRSSELLEDLYGFSFAMCDGGDIRTAPGGTAWIYGTRGREHVTVDGPAGTDFIVSELYQALRKSQAASHDGAWGLACLELCIALRESSKSGGFVRLRHQAFGTDGFFSDDWPLRAVDS